MPPPSVHTTLLHNLIGRMRAGDGSAREELLAGVGHRLERLARKLLRQFPTVKRWSGTDDVLQNSLLRLLRSLEKVPPAGPAGFDSMRDFFNLAARMMRQELIDLYRHLYGPHGLGANSGGPLTTGDSAAEEGLEPPAAEECPEDLEEWCRFHEAVEGLPAEEREVMSLVYYHGWTQQQVADFLGCHVRTIRRKYADALCRLQGNLRESEGGSAAEEEPR